MRLQASFPPHRWWTHSAGIREKLAFLISSSPLADPHDPRPVFSPLAEHTRSVGRPARDRRKPTRD